ncbi:hypothetical protein B296_00052069 [Ensete ventricosum]|uniref:Uncharacterized protein n=1 Tax=Ensete ventricosum TaxID=4639 RepID=A0A426X8E0_ENSVE|nr:hypothetical protein B296_00052069 [Ensete ventricosum]
MSSPHQREEPMERHNPTLDSTRVMSLTFVQGKLCASAQCSLFYIDSIHAAWILYQVPPKLLRLSICIELMVALMLTIPRLNASILHGSGKSTLMNHLFGTNFREMDAFKGRYNYYFKVTSWVEEASDVSVGGGGSYGPLPRWWKELHMEATTAEGSAHESSTFGLVHWRQRKRRSCAFVAEVATETRRRQRLR